MIITGAAGTIGTALHNQFPDATGYDVTPQRWTNHDVQIHDLTSTGLMEHGHDTVVHLAANARVHRSVNNPELAMRNSRMTFNVLEYCRRNDARMIFTSSREVYGDRDTDTREGETYVDGQKSPYSASKYGDEAMIHAYGEAYDLDYTIVRLSNVYGAYDISDRVIPRWLGEASRGETISVFGGNKTLDFTYIDDTIRGLKSVIQQRTHEFNTFNIMSGNSTELETLAHMIVDKMDSHSPVAIDSNRAGEVERFTGSIDQAEKILGYEPEYDLDEGLDLTIDWYHQHVL